MGSPAQQLLDRFLIGYPRDGGFHHLKDCKIGILFDKPSPLLRQRKDDFGLIEFSNLGEALARADGIVVTWKGIGVEPKPGRLHQILEQATPGARCFVHGNLAHTAAEATKLFEQTATSKISLTSGTSMSGALQLPELQKPANGSIREFLIITHGNRGEAELDAVMGLLQFSDFKIATLKQLQGHYVWKAADAGEWSGKLVAAALSRSNTTQGGALRDGRTQDIYGLGLLPTLAKTPRAIIMQGQSGIRATILILDGAIADTTLAFSDETGAIFSTQLYRPPAPNREEFSRFAATIEDFFHSGTAFQSADQSYFVADFFDRFRELRFR